MLPKPLESSMVRRAAALAESVEVSVPIKLLAAARAMEGLDPREAVTVTYATADGIQVKEAKIPSGKHRVRITVSDTAGSTTVKELMLEVL